MKKLLLDLLDNWLIFVYCFGQVLVPIPVLAQPKGVVDYTLEWHSGHHVYTYVFAGVVSSQGRPCPNAKVQLQLSTPDQPDLVQETVASAEGAYELKVSFICDPQQPADWKLVAQAPTASVLEATEIEGRAILTEDENTVEVQRPIQLVQG
jgi:hypothetical protein